MIILDSKNFFLNELKKEFNQSLDDKTIVYLSGVLNKFLINNEDSRPKYLSLIMKDILESSDNREISRLLLNLGEQSLFFASLFPSIIFKRNLNLTYYFSMGSGAYISLAQRENNQNKKDIFNKVSKNFQFIVNGISVIKKDNNMSKIELIESWQESENSHYLNLLLEKGIIPPPKKSTDFCS